MVVTISVLYYTDSKAWKDQNGKLWSRIFLSRKVPFILIFFLIFTMNHHILCVFVCFQFMRVHVPSSILFVVRFGARIVIERSKV